MPKPVKKKAKPGEIDVSSVVFREDLYPRIEKDPALVQRYAENIEVLPPIEINQRKELIDGWHRWTAHKKKKIGRIPVIVTKTKSDAEVAALAYERNSTAGKQLDEKEKSRGAILMYNGGEGLSKLEIAKRLSVKPDTVTRYLSDIDSQLKVGREERMLSLWLACRTQREIGEEVGLTQQAIALFLQEIQKTVRARKLVKPAILHEDGFEAQVYSVWSFGKATNEVRHFGNIPPEIIDNLLYYYTKPFDVVFDPFGGGGSTIDVCKKRYRRYFVSDLTPIEEREHEIRQHDITKGLPSELPVPDFVFLDPPYWKQAEGKYSESKTDLSNVSLDKFLGSIGAIASAAKRKWTQKHSGKLALIIGPWKDKGQYVDLAFLCYQRIAKYLSLVQRVTVPYSTQVHGGAFVEKAKQKREILYLTRDLMVFGLSE